MAARPITDVEPRGDTGRRQRPPLPPRAPVPATAPPRRLRRLAHDRAALAVVAMMAVYAGAFAWLSVARHRSFSTGRFDLGNMVQALWNTAHGRFFETTDVSGVQFNRLGAHVNLVLAMFTPLWWAWPSPEMLLVAQAVIVAAGALPAFWLGRRWLQDDRLAVAFAGVYLLFPALQHATLFDFHPVTLAAPLLMYCIWAAEERHYVVLGICAALACLTPGAGGPGGRRPGGVDVVPPPRPAPRGDDPGRRLDRLGGRRDRRDHARLRDRRLQPAHHPLLEPRRLAERDPDDLRHPALGRVRGARHARPVRLPGRPAAAAAAAAARRAAAGARGPAPAA